MDETIERRRGEKIAARGIYRDSVRSSGSHWVKASGWRWISLMWLTPISWAERIGALLFLTILATSERYDTDRYRKALSAFADALALVRFRIWRDWTLQMSASDTDVIMLPRKLAERFNDLLAYAV